MNFSETFRIAISSLLINRLRSALTTLGIVIGVGAVIGLVSLGRGVEAFIAAEFQTLGSNILEITSSQPNSPTRSRIDPLTTIEAADLVNPFTAPDIVQIAATYESSGIITAGSERTQAAITGATANYAEVRSWPVQLGDFIVDSDVEDTQRVAVIGLDVVETLFGSRDANPVGQSIQVNDRSFVVIGVMSERGGSFGVSEDGAVIVPITTAQTRLDNARARDGGYRLTRMYVEVTDEEAVESARQDIQVYLNQAHSIIFDDEQDYSISTASDILSIVNQISALLTVFLVMIASISLLVGGIGVMNIMLVSVTERTREIGLRKAVGARQGDILAQFLMESIMLSILGGLLGIVLGWIVSILVTALVADLTVTVSPDAVVLATGISTLVGVFFGFYPARRAALMKPIDALRFE
ncbi:MAG: ABC transporter permease [Anaerolineaceae bacterium]|nr:ABC transporter permease [Anaerolineaceae bacterium]